jgi:hypothetical protein
MDQSLEQWRPVAGLEDRYEVSDHGRVRSLPRITMRGIIPQRVRGKVIAQRQSPEGYGRVTLITPAGRVHKQVHRLVAEAFCDNPQGCDVVNHIDNCPSNNLATNLEWTTLQGNSQHCWKQGRAYVPSLPGGANPNARHSEEQAKAVIVELSTRKPHTQIAQELGVSRSFVSEISCGRQWRHLPR